MCLWFCFYPALPLNGGFWPGGLCSGVYVRSRSGDEEGESCKHNDVKLLTVNWSKDQECRLAGKYKKKCSISQNYFEKVKTIAPDCSCEWTHQYYRKRLGWVSFTINPRIQAVVWPDCTNRSRASNRSRALNTSRISKVGSACESTFWTFVYCLLSETSVTRCLPSVCCNEDTNRSRGPRIKDLRYATIYFFVIV